MIQLLKQMNAVLADWRVQFDPLSETNLAFRLTDRGEVFLNQYRLTRLPGLILVQAAIHADTIVFSFDANRFLEISLHWPEEKRHILIKSPGISSFSNTTRLIHSQCISSFCEQVCSRLLLILFIE